MRELQVPFVLEQDEDGNWAAHAQLRPVVGANGAGDSPEEAAADLRDALTGLVEAFGKPDQLTVIVEAPRSGVRPDKEQSMKHEIQVPFSVEQDEDGVWAAEAALLPNAFANGQGDTREEAIEDLRGAIEALADEVGVPEILVVTVEVDD